MGYRYIGAKTAVIGAILKKISEVVGENAKVADLMCGTAAVSVALRKNGYSVTANDVMTYSYHHARVALFFAKPPMFKDARDFIAQFSRDHNQGLFPTSPYESMLSALNHVPPKEGYFWREFSAAGCPRNTKKPRNYFSPANAKKIDAIRSWIRR